MENKKCMCKCGKPADIGAFCTLCYLERKPEWVKPWQRRARFVDLGVVRK
jgi:hypothetical protein